MLPSSKGGADGAIGVCSLNLLGGVSGMRFGVLPSDMFAVLCGAGQQHGFHVRKLARDALAMEIRTKASKNRSRQARLRLRAAERRFQTLST